MNKAEIGTISFGTLRGPDLMENFSYELQRIQEGTENRKLLTEAQNWLEEYDEASQSAESFDWESLEERGSEIINDLETALNNLAPVYCYFGSIEGDGADYGFWIDHERLDEAIRYGTPWEADSEYVYDPDSEAFIHVNDHGNVTVLTNTDDAPGEVIWSAV
jgi:hypothetical protein